MRRTLVTTVMVSVLFAAPALAQHPGAKPDAKADSTMKQLVGSWEGAVYSDHAPESLLKFTFANGTAFKITVSIVSNGQEFVTGDATELKVDGNSISWNVGLMQQPCKGTGVLIAGALKGDFTCGEMGGITYLAKKK